MVAFFPEEIDVFLEIKKRERERERQRERVSERERGREGKNIFEKSAQKEVGF